ncbi:MAG: hypothetical protein JNJ81_07810, partial [Candidatus Accumulibacter sp.]|nr:hypothetical protein [Accumulibacter sp.]
NRDFFPALASIEANRIDALWACYDGRTQAAIVQPAVLGALVTAYRDVLKRQGSDREQDSVVDQLQFLIDMLPAGDESDPVKGALTSLIEGIRTGLVRS